MENQNKNSSLITGFIIGFIFSLILIFNFNNKENTTTACEEIVDVYRDKLHEADKTIEDLNYQIEEAKASAWSSYEEMGEALDSLETAEIVE